MWWSRSSFTFGHCQLSSFGPSLPIPSVIVGRIFKAKSNLLVLWTLSVQAEFDLRCSLTWNDIFRNPSYWSWPLGDMFSFFSTKVFTCMVKKWPIKLRKSHICYHLLTDQEVGYQCQVNAMSLIKPPFEIIHFFEFVYYHVPKYSSTCYQIYLFVCLHYCSRNQLKSEPLQGFPPLHG